MIDNSIIFQGDSVKRLIYKISFGVVLLFITSVSFCHSVKKSQKPVTFSYQDFENVVAEVDESYIDKNINKNRAFTDATITALASLPHPLYIYPESFFKERDKYEEKDDIMPGKTFKISPVDKYIIFDPDYEKIKELRKEKANDKNKKMDNEEVHRLIEKDKIRKSVLYAKWSEVNFNKKDFDRILSFVESNLQNYSKPVVLDDRFKSETDDKPFTMNNVYLSLANGYLNSLDPHTNVFAKEEWEESMAKIQDSSFEGIGAILSGGGTRDVIVENPLEDRPAVKAGIRAGDVIVAVDDKPVKGLMLDKVVEMIKGPKGSNVSLTIQRTGNKNYLNIKVSRDKIEIKNLSAHLIEGHDDIAYIKLSGFVKTPDSPDVDAEIIQKLRELENEALQKKSRLKAVVLDLRNNAGGYLDLAVDIADFFIKKGLIVSVKGSDQSPDDKYAKIKDISNLPMAVLVNARSASASEIVASAIKYHGRGLVLGERTFGKATVQKLMPLKSNSDYLIKITQSRYYSPSGDTIQVVGVKPDIEISAEEDGTFPFQYREEDMWNHLPELPQNGMNKSRFNLDKLSDWVKKHGQADEYLKKHKNSPIKPDYQLIRSVDYIEALINTK